VLLIVAVLFGLAGCAQKPARNNQADIERALREYLNKKPSVSSQAMQIQIQQVQYQGDTAEADVLFRSKTNPDASVTMKYVLKQTGPGSWQVEGPKPGAPGHGNMPASAGAMASPRGGAGNAGAGEASGMANPHAPAANPHAAGAPAQPKPGQQPKSGK
jgi:hypothetical protein